MELAGFYRRGMRGDGQNERETARKREQHKREKERETNIERDRDIHAPDRRVRPICPCKAGSRRCHTRVRLVCSCSSVDCEAHTTWGWQDEEAGFALAHQPSWRLPLRLMCNAPCSSRKLLPARNPRALLQANSTYLPQHAQPARVQHLALFFCSKIEIGRASCRERV